MSGYRVGDAHPAKNTTPHGSHADPLRTCDECGASFKPRILIGANASRFCGTPCKDRWHARARKKERPLSAATEAGGETKPNHSELNNTPRASIRPGTKLASVAEAIYRGEILDCFMAVRHLHDFVLHSTISELEHRYGVRIERKTKRVPGHGGKLVTCCDYWAGDESRAHLGRLLGRE